MSFLNPLYQAVAWLMVHIHAGVAHVLGANSGYSWALSIILLTIGMRLVLFPVFVKQIRNQRAMQKVQPKMKELQAKYKNDKEELNRQMMALWKEAGANPFSGCLPLVLQIPIFISLFHTLRQLKPQKGCTDPHLSTVACYHGVPGFPQHLVASAAQAKIFGVPIQASFTTSATFLHDLGGNQTSTRILCLVLTILMGASTFITQRQLMARNGPAEGQMAQQQKILLYVFPVLFLFYGFKFPIGVLLYWLTTNVWSMAQQSVVIRRMDVETAVPAVGVTGAPLGPPPGVKPTKRPDSASKPPPPNGTPPPKPDAGGTTTNGSTPAKPPNPGKSTTRSSGTRRPANSRNRNRNKRGRR